MGRSAPKWHTGRIASVSSFSAHTLNMFVLWFSLSMLYCYWSYKSDSGSRSRVSSPLPATTGRCLWAVYSLADSHLMAPTHTLRTRSQQLVLFCCSSKIKNKDTLHHAVGFQLTEATILLIFVLRETIVNRTYGEHRNLYISQHLLTKFGPIYYGPP